MFKRIFLVVLDSFGIGELPDSKSFKDEGSNTFRSVNNSNKLDIPILKKLGIYNINGIDFGNKEITPIGAYGKCIEKSMGKDTTTGHWEMVGVINESPFPTYPQGFPETIINEIEKLSGRKVLCNKAYSGTEVIKDYGEEQIESKGIIVYTSADSVLQIAAHIDIVPLEELYDICEKVRKIMINNNNVGRIIARPFKGVYPFERTSDRKDYSITPPYNTLNYLKDNNKDVIGVGKIHDIFNGSGLTDVRLVHGNVDCINESNKIINESFNGLCFINLVDFDMNYGHRNDVDGYAEALTKVDNWLSNFITKINSEDLLIITADHGCDPGTISTDHSREYTPLLVYNKNINTIDLGIRKTFSDIGKTILDNYNIDNDLPGTSFLKEVKND